MTTTPSFSLRQLIALVLSLPLFLTPLYADSATWDGSEADNLWSTLLNWGAGSPPAAVPGTGDTATFDETGAAGTIDLSGGITLNHIIFNNAGIGAYTIGIAGVDTISFDNDGGVDANAAMNADQIIAADIILGDGEANAFQIDTESTTNRIIITGDIDTGTGVAMGDEGVQRIEIGDLGGASNGKTVQIDGNISKTGDATRIEMFVGGADLIMNGNVLQQVVGDNTQRTRIRDTATVTVNAGANVGEGSMEVRNGTLNINSDIQFFRDGLFLGNNTQANGNATVNIGAANTLNLDSGLVYIDDDNTANIGIIQGGTLQITGANRAVTVHDNLLIDPSSPELTITSTITNDGSQRDLTIRGPDSESAAGTVLIAPTNMDNDFGGITVQAGIVQLGEGAFGTTTPDFLNITTWNDEDYATGTVATADLLGNTFTLGNGSGDPTVGHTLTFGNASTNNLLVDNGFESNLISTGGQGTLNRLNGITYNKGSDAGGVLDDLNAAATVQNVDLNFDTSGNNKAILINDGSATVDLTFTNSNIATTVSGNSIQIRGDGTVEFGGTSSLTTTGVGDIDFNMRKAILGENTTVTSGDIIFVRQRNDANFSDFDVELDINGATLTPPDDIVVSAFSTTNITTFTNVRITDSAGTGELQLAAAGVNLTYNSGTANENRTTFIEANIQMIGGARNFVVNDGADTVDLDISGRITDDNNGGSNLNKQQAGTLRLSNSGNLYNILSIQAGTVIVTDVGALGDNDIQLGTNAVNGVLEFDLAGDQTVASANQIRLGDNTAGATRTGGGSVISNGTGAVTFGMGTFNEARGTSDALRTLTLGGSNTGNNTISGTIQNNSASGIVSLVKQDAGTWILDGNNTFTGSTTLSAGTLILNGTNTSAISVAAGATLGGSGSTSGSITLVDGSRLSVDGSAGGLQTTDMTSGLVLSGVTMGGVIVDVTNVGTGAFTVLDYGGTATDFTPTMGDTLFSLGTFPTGTRTAGTFADTGTAITLDFGAGIRTWSATNDSTWNKGAMSSTNWIEGDNLFFDGDAVVFTDSTTNAMAPATSQSIAVGVDVAPSSVVFSNNDFAYTIKNSGAGAITGAATITKSGTNTVTIQNANTYTGGTTLGQGVLAIENSSALGTGTITINDDGDNPTLQLRANNLNVANDIFLSDVGGARTLQLNTGAAGAVGEFSGDIVIQENSSFRDNISVSDATSILTLSGAISGLTGGAGLEKVGSGRAVFTNANSSFTGSNRIAQGTAEFKSIADIGVNSSAGAGANFIIGNSVNNGILDYTGSTEASTNRTVRIGNSNGTTANSDIGNATILANGTSTAAKLVFTGATFNNLQGNSTSGSTAARTLTLGGSNLGDNEIQGVISDNNDMTAGAVNTVSLAKSGTGKWSLSGANTYTGGTTVTSGTLLINGDNSGATGAVTVASGATLGGTGNIGGTTTFSAGSNQVVTNTTTTAGTQTFSGNLVYNASTASNTTVSWNLVNTANAAGSGYDFFDLGANTLDFSGITDTGSIAFAINDQDNINQTPGSEWWRSNQTFTVWDYGSLNPSAAGLDIFDITYSGVNSGNGVSAGAFAFSDDGGAIVLNFTAVPEPSTFSLLGLGLAAFGWGIRRRRNRAERVGH